MVHWHERLAARIGLRIVGLALLGATWFEGARLQDMVSASPNADASYWQIILAALMFASASAGLMLAFVGAGLWKPVTVSDRWATRVPIPVPRELEPAIYAMTTTQGDHVNQESRDTSYDGERSPVRHPHLSSAGRW